MAAKIFFPPRTFDDSRPAVVAVKSPHVIVRSTVPEWKLFDFFLFSRPSTFFALRRSREEGKISSSSISLCCEAAAATGGREVGGRPLSLFLSHMNDDTGTFGNPCCLPLLLEKRPKGQSGLRG